MHLSLPPPQQLIFIILIILTYLTGRIRAALPCSLPSLNNTYLPFHELQHQIQRLEQDMLTMEAHRGVIVTIGLSGSGKSTTVNFATKQPLHVLLDDFGYTYSRIDPFNPPCGAIGSRFTSNTTIPCILENFIDMPGLNDNRGPVTEITGKFALTKILTNFSSITFLICIPQYYLVTQDRACRLKELISHLQPLIAANSVETFVTFSNIVVTFATHSDTHVIRSRFRRMLEEVPNLSRNQARILLEWSKEDFNRISFIRMPTRAGILHPEDYTSVLKPYSVYVSDIHYDWSFLSESVREFLDYMKRIMSHDIITIMDRFYDRIDTLTTEYIAEHHFDDSGRLIRERLSNIVESIQTSVNDGSVAALGKAVEVLDPCTAAGLRDIANTQSVLISACGLRGLPLDVQVSSVSLLIEWLSGMTRNPVLEASPDRLVVIGGVVGARDLSDSFPISMFPADSEIEVVASASHFFFDSDLRMQNRSLLISAQNCWLGTALVHVDLSGAPALTPSCTHPGGNPGSPGNPGGHFALSCTFHTLPRYTLKEEVGMIVNVSGGTGGSGCDGAAGAPGDPAIPGEISHDGRVLLAPHLHSVVPGILADVHIYRSGFPAGAGGVGGMGGRGGKGGLPGQTHLPPALILHDGSTKSDEVEELSVMNAVQVVRDVGNRGLDGVGGTGGAGGRHSVLYQQQVFVTSSNACGIAASAALSAGILLTGVAAVRFLDTPGGIINAMYAVNYASGTLGVSTALVGCVATILISVITTVTNIFFSESCQWGATLPKEIRDRDFKAPDGFRGGCCLDWPASEGSPRERPFPASFTDIIMSSREKRVL